MQDTPAKTPWHLWLVGVFATLFNAIGVFDYVMNLAKGPAYLANAGFTPEQVAHYQAMPAWMMGVWAVGVFSAFAASIALLLRRALAAPVFRLSLAAFGVSVAYNHILTNGAAILGRQMSITSAVIAALLLLFALYAQAQARRGVLR